MNLLWSKFQHMWELPTRTIRGRLLVTFIALGTGLALVLGAVTYLGAREALLDEAFGSIEGLKESRAVQVANWVNDLRRDLEVFAENSTTITAARAFRSGVAIDVRYGATHGERLASIGTYYRGQPELIDAVGFDVPYRSTHQRFHEFFKNTSEVYEYTDILIISPTGDVLYSVQKRDDFMSNIFEPPYADTPLAVSVQSIVENRAENSLFTDFSFYPAYPSEEPVAFFLAPIYDRSEFLGIVAYQVDGDQLDSILTIRDGLGVTGETYLLGQDDLFRTSSRFLVDANVVVNPDYKVVTAAANSEDVDDTSPEFITNYVGNPVLSTWKSIVVETPSTINPDGVIWTLIAERSVDEVIAPTTRLLGLLVVVVLIVLGILFVLSYFIANQISRPILKLKEAAEQIAQGTFSQQIDVTSNDEIGILAQAFKKMSNDVQKSLTDLQKAERLAKENNRLKSEFLSTMSHELRTPLNAITGFTSVLLAGWGVNLGNREKTMVERISENSTRLLALINDFLDLSRIEAGRMMLVPAPAEITKLVKGWEDQMSVLAEQKKLDFSVYLDPNLPPTFTVDQEALSKVVINLLSNAFKFTETGSVKLSVVLGMGQVLIHVKDTGIGIPQHAQEYIFDEFRQEDGSTTRKYGGTGLGLAIARKIITLMGGKIILESTVGEGSTFTLSVPLNFEDALVG